MSRPTEAACEAAMQIIHGPYGFFSNDQPKPTAIEVALVIDSCTQLPEKHAALLLAQAVVDAAEKGDAGLCYFDEELIGNLREALTKIKQPPSSGCVTKDDSQKQPPQAGQVAQDPPA